MILRRRCYIHKHIEFSNIYVTYKQTVKCHHMKPGGICSSDQNIGWNFEICYVRISLARDSTVRSLFATKTNRPWKTSSHVHTYTHMGIRRCCVFNANAIVYFFSFFFLLSFHCMCLARQNDKSNFKLGNIYLLMKLGIGMQKRLNKREAS